MKPSTDETTSVAGTTVVLEGLMRLGLGQPVSSLGVFITGTLTGDSVAWTHVLDWFHELG